MSEISNDFDLKNWDLLDKEKAEFILEQAKSKLEYCLESIDTIDNKSFIILASLFAIVCGLSGYVFTKINFKQSFYCQNWNLILPLLTFDLFQLIGCFLLIKNLALVDCISPGNDPKNILTDKILDQKFPMFVATEIMLYQERISGNLKTIEKKSEYFKWVLRIIFWSIPITILISVVIYHFF